MNISWETRMSCTALRLSLARCLVQRIQRRSKTSSRYFGGQALVRLLVVAGWSFLSLPFPSGFVKNLFRPRLPSMLAAVASTSLGLWVGLIVQDAVRGYNRFCQAFLYLVYCIAYNLVFLTIFKHSFNSCRTVSISTRRSGAALTFQKESGTV